MTKILSTTDTTPKANMKTSDQIMLVKWFNHYEDQHLLEPYHVLEKLIESNKDKMNCAYEGKRFSVYSYNSSIENEVKSKTDELFEPEFHNSLNDWKAKYYEWDDSVDADELSDSDFIYEIEYNFELDDIMKESGGDEREFSRIWCERF